MIALFDFAIALLLDVLRIVGWLTETLETYAARLKAAWGEA